VISENRTKRPWTRPALVAVLILLAGATGCATRIPPSSGSRMSWATPVDSLFLSPLCPEPGGNVEMPRPLDRSRGQVDGYLRVWLDFLHKECAGQGLALLTARRSDSLAVAAFQAGLAPAAWQTQYGALPGARSRVVDVSALRLLAVRRNGFQRFLEGLNLLDSSDRDYGWVELDYTVLDPAGGDAPNRRTLVSREPDTPWVSGMVDRAGRLMTRAARDLARDLEARRVP
jgi:hypothetical protein